MKSLQLLLIVFVNSLLCSSARAVVMKCFIVSAHSEGTVESTGQWTRFYRVRQSPGSVSRQDVIDFQIAHNLKQVTDEKSIAFVAKRLL